ncbi:MAG: SHOCT domain-containing protein [Thermodesulfobacteriota bacterium]
MTGTWFMNGGMGIWMLFNMLFWIPAIIVIVLLIVWAIRKTGGNGPKTGEDNALDVLKKRYARGEINKEEYEEKKRDIS